MLKLLEKLKAQGSLSKAEFLLLLEAHSKELQIKAAEMATEFRKKAFDNNVYIRGVIEISNYCHNNCFYCGIRRENSEVERYRLKREEILSCCKQGYELGFRTFVLQGGEDAYFTEEIITGLIREIKELYKDCAITLSLGEKKFETYKAYKEAGADRYLLRHETASEKHYQILHPEYQKFESRMRCLQDLKKLGFQTGTGFMVGSPGQTLQNLAEDLFFISKFRPEMVGIGPFISHKSTPFAKAKNGSLDLTLYLLSILRIMLPKVLLPATTALGSIDPRGRELGILAGANVIMPNLSPEDTRDKYSLYDNKLKTGPEAAEGLKELAKRLAEIDCKIAIARGDFPG